MNTIYIQNVIYTIYIKNYFVNLILFFTTGKYSICMLLLIITLHHDNSILRKCFIFCMICILIAVCDLNPATVFFVAFILFVQVTAPKYFA